MLDNIIIVFSALISLLTANYLLESNESKKYFLNLAIISIIVVISFFGSKFFSVNIVVILISMELLKSVIKSFSTKSTIMGVLCICGNIMLLNLPIMSNITLSNIDKKFIVGIYLVITTLLVIKGKDKSFDRKVIRAVDSNRLKKYSLIIDVFHLSCWSFFIGISSLVYFYAGNIDSYFSRVIVACVIIFIIFEITGGIGCTLFLRECLENVLNLRNKNKMDTFFKIIRSQRHDFNFHLTCVNNLIAQGEYKECKSYIKKVVKEFQDISDVLPIADPAISAMIMSFKYLAEENNIDLDIDISYNMSNMSCSTYEINTIIANILQNAIDEVLNSNIRHKRIKLLILKRMGMLVVKVSNPLYVNKIESREILKIGMSTKDRDYHEGIGLSIVKGIVDKYDGKIHIEYEESIFNMIIYIPLE